MDNTGEAIGDIVELNSISQDIIIHHEDSRTFFSITTDELNLLEKSGNHIWKEICFAAIGVGIPTLLNVCLEYYKLSSTDRLTFSIILNAAISLISLTAGSISGYCWKNNNQSFTKMIQKIKNKPKYKLPNVIKRKTSNQSARNML